MSDSNSVTPDASPVRPIPCQRAHFDLPDDLSWLNCAQHSPALNAVHGAALEGLDRKRHPWRLGPQQYQEDVQSLRKTFASLIGATADDVALAPSAAYGLSIAARNLPFPAGGRIVVLADQFPSNVYPWRDLARKCAGEVVTLSWPQDGDWTSAVEAALDERVKILAIPHFHWTDGSRLDLTRLAARSRAVGAALVLDLSQSLGAVPFDVTEVQPDFLVSVAYKWLLGPYRFAFLYAAPHRQNGEPLEQAWSSRAGSADSTRLTEYRDEMLPGARRYDVGERGDYIAIPMARAALDQILDWGVGSIANGIEPLVTEIAERAEALGLGTAPKSFRAPHMIGLRLPGDCPRDMPQRLAAKKVYVSLRGTTLRVSPHLYNDRGDLDRFFEALASEI